MSPEILQLIAWSTLDTLMMVGLAGLFGTLLGLPLGIFLATSRANELFPAPNANRILGFIVNATRSTPFIILVVAIVPLTRLIAGTSIGTRAAIVPLTIAAIPFIARVIEAAIREVDQGLVEAARGRYSAINTSLRSRRRASSLLFLQGTRHPCGPSPSSLHEIKKLLN